MFMYIILMLKTFVHFSLCYTVVHISTRWPRALSWDRGECMALES